MNNISLSDAILSIFSPRDIFINDDTGEKFQAVTQTDLMERLREKGWRLPPAGYFLNEVESAGFKSTQGYQFKGKVRRYYEGRSERLRKPAAISLYQTLIHI